MSDVGSDTLVPPRPRRIVGYERQRARLGALLEGSGGAVALLGPAGSGKSALLAEAREGAGGRTVLACRGHRSEAHLPYSGLSDLLAPVAARIMVLGGPRRRAVAAALALEDGPPPDTLSVATGTLQLVLETAPALVLVDDFGWLDDSSARVVEFVANRLDGSRVAAILAARTDDVDASLERIRLTGLDRAAALQVVADAAARPPTEYVLDVLHHWTRGSPLALRAAGSVLTAAQLAGQESVDDLLVLLAEPAEAFRSHLATLSEDARAVAGLLAAASRLKGSELNSACGVMGIAPTAIGELTRVQVVTSTEPVSLAHPLLDSAAWSLLPAPEWARIHRALAVVVEDADRRVRHLVAATAHPDRAVAEEITAAAGRASSRGAAAESAHLLEQAAALHPEPDVARTHRVAAARAWRVAGSPHRAALLLDVLESNDPRPPIDVVDVRAELLTWTTSARTARDYLLQQAQRHSDPGVRAALICRAAIPSVMAGLVSQSRHEVALALEDLPRDDPRVAFPALLGAAEVLVLTGQSSQALELLDPVTARMTMAPVDRSSLVLSTMLAHVLSLAQRWGDARVQFERLLDDARRRGLLAVLPLILAQLADLDLRMGRFASAAAGLDEAVQIAGAQLESVELPHALALQARLHALTGDTVGCRQAVDEAVGYVQRHGTDALVPYLEYALGLSCLGEGRPHQAVIHLDAAQRTIEAHGVRSVSAVPVLPDLIEAAVLAGEDALARQRLDDLSRGAAADATVWARAAHARSLALVERDPSFLDAARNGAREIGSVFDAARADLVEGELRRRSGDRTAARACLGDALACFERIGARPWADRARRELRAAGGHPEVAPLPLQRLTPQQQRIAELAASGATNIEIAASLFLAVKTVENHLTRIYQRLDVRSRTGLANLTLRSGATTE